MDNPLGFPTMRPISREPEIQGEPPQVISLNSPLSKGEHPSTVSLVTSSGNISSFMDILFGSKTLKCSDPLERPESFKRFEDQVDEAIASALEGINLTLSMDNPLGFPTMSPVS